jgi:hypothetical protein
MACEYRRFQVESIERLDRVAVEVIPGLLEADLAVIVAKLKLSEPFLRRLGDSSSTD